MKEFKWPKELKKTKSREQVLAILTESQRPMTALEIYQQTEKEGTPVWLSTIYRILAAFTDHEEILKTAVLENGMGIYELNRNEHKHYAMCVACNKVTPIANCPMGEFQLELKENNFHVLGHKLEMYGYCDACYSVLRNDR